MKSDRPKGVDCVEWELDWSDPSARRCRHYSASGACSIRDGAVCEELLRRRARVAASPEIRPIVPPTEKTFRLTPCEPRQASARRKNVRLRYVSSLTSTRVQGMPAERLESVASSDIGEVILQVDDVCVEPSGPVVLVAERTGRKDRMELTYRDASTLRLLIDVFPGARITHLRRKREDDDDDDEGLQE